MFREKLEVAATANDNNADHHLAIGECQEFGALALAATAWPADLRRKALAALRSCSLEAAQRSARAPTPLLCLAGGAADDAAQHASHHRAAAHVEVEEAGNVRQLLLVKFRE